MVEYFDTPYHRWKIDGNVATIHSRLVANSPSLTEFFNAKRIKESIQILKSKGVTIVEFWVPPACHDFAKPWFARQKIQFEVVRVEESGQIFCRLVL